MNFREIQSSQDARRIPEIQHVIVMHLINSQFIDFVSTRCRFVTRIVMKISALARNLAATEYKPATKFVR